MQNKIRVCEMQIECNLIPQAGTGIKQGQNLHFCRQRSHSSRLKKGRWKLNESETITFLWPNRFISQIKYKFSLNLNMMI